MKEASQKQKYIWNMMGSMSNAFSSVILLLIVNRLLGSEKGGIFSFAFANAQLMMTIGGFEVRPIQSTDVKREYKFQTYFTFRLVTCFAMILCCLGYLLFSKTSGEKAIIIITLCVYKLIEVFIDVFEGLYQSRDRIDLGGKSFSLRVIASTCTFTLVLILSKNLVTASVSMVIVSFLLIFIYDLNIIRKFKDIKFGFCLEKIKDLFLGVLPLFISSFIMMYINNAPKYAINKYCSDLMQNKYSILFMPAFVINLFSLFMFRPILVDMANKWKDNDIKGLLYYIKRSLVYIIVITVICVIGARTIGLPILSILYATDLADSKLLLTIIMVYGGLSATGTYLYYVITVIRKQKQLLIGYAIAFIISFTMSPLLVKKHLLIGAAASSLSALLILDCIFGMIIYLAIKKRKVTYNKSGEKV